MAPLPPVTNPDIPPEIEVTEFGLRHSRNSIKLDKYATRNGLIGVLHNFPYSTDYIRLLLLSKYARLAYKLGLSRSAYSVGAIAVDMDKFRTRPSANYDIRGRPFSSLDNGTYGRNGLRPRDPRVDKVKSFLRRHLNREPTDKDVDWVTYTYFGSDAFNEEYGTGSDLYYGMQDSFYNERGRKKLRDNFNRWPRVRRYQRRIATQYYGNGNSNSNSNSNSNNTPLAYTYYGGTSISMVNWANNYFSGNSNSNSNNTPTTTSRITWEKKFVKNMPTNEVGSLDNFKNGNKVIQYKVGKVNKYISPYTFQKLSKMSPIRAYNKPQTQILFKNPFTRANVKRGEIKFMVLKNAATKIQSVVRGKKARNVVQAAARRKLLANAAAKRK
jgi:hypothetical protein